MNNKKSEIKKLFSIILVNFLLVLAGIIFIYASTFIDNDSGDFNLGTYNFTFYNSSGFIQLNSSRLNGSYMTGNVLLMHFNKRKENG